MVTSDEMRPRRQRELGNGWVGGSGETHTLLAVGQRERARERKSKYTECMRESGGSKAICIVKGFSGGGEKRR